MEDIKPCIEKANCVSSLNKKEEKYYISNFNIQENIIKSKEKLKNICVNNFKAELIEEKENYLHFLFKTKILKFKDDVEFILKDNIIEVKSASRVGYYDFNTNRKRIEKIRKIYLE